ncbi:MAG TPA: tetratricopeptide repeat protein [Caldilineaceae bacterium]|nr:tetratricopeptide repeat protein [Caldilineaceae bacterium]
MSNDQNDRHMRQDVGPPLSEVMHWRRHLLQAYQDDALRAIAYFKANSVDQIFIERVLELLRTYVELPGAGQQPLPADDTILQLAHLVAGQVFQMGYWRQMRVLWPKLTQLAEFLDDPERYVNFVKRLAIVKGRQYDGQEGLKLYQQLIADPRFQKTSTSLQADILCHVGTVLLWNGKSSEAEPLLQQCMELTRDHAQLARKDAPRGRERRYNLEAAPLWETRSYAMNQLGVLHMFKGKFAQARAYFGQIMALYVEYDQLDNLACVAHQAIGRLLLYSNDHVAAIATLTRGLTIRRRHNDIANTAINQAYIAAAEIQLGNLEHAAILLRDALYACEGIDNLHDVAICHLYLGELAYLRRQWHQMVYHWQTTIDIAKKVELHFVEVRSWFAYLLPLFRRGHLRLALQICRTLWRSSCHDHLSPAALGRFLVLSLPSSR